MEPFKGESGQVEQLRAELRVLYDRDIKSGELVRRVEKEAKSLGIECMTRWDIHKLRTGTVKRPRDIEKAVALWNVVFSDPFLRRDAPPSPVAADNLNTPEHEFFHSSVKFFHVRQHHETRAKDNLPGRFMFYHFSEVFHKFSASIPRAVVVGQWDIDLAGGAFCIEEKQDYYGSLGKQERHDIYNGYSLPKGRNICFIMREAHKEIPKFYMLESSMTIPSPFRQRCSPGIC